MHLNLFDNRSFDRGKGFLFECVWILVGSYLVASRMPGARWRCIVLRFFGARIGRMVVFKPRVRVKFPWKLHVGDFTWIGEDVWIDNLGDVTVGSHVCISQGAYLCTGSHDWSSISFDLMVSPITVRDHAWICAMAKIGPGVVIEEGAVATFGSIISRNLDAWTIHDSRGTFKRRAVLI